MLLGPGETLVSRNGSDPSWLGFSIVNCVCVDPACGCTVEVADCVLPFG